MLAALGRLVGVWLGQWTSRLLTTIHLLGDLPVRFDFHFDSRVLAYAVALTTVTGVLVGWTAARRASRTNVDQAVHDYGHGSASNTGGHQIRSALVVAQIAVCFMLLDVTG